MALIVLHRFEFMLALIMWHGPLRFGFGASGDCPPAVLPDHDIDGRCVALLPPLSFVKTSELLERVVNLLEGPGTLFPFSRLGFGFDIGDREARELDESVFSRAGGEGLENCKPSTYGEMRVDILGRMFLPGSRGELSADDVLVDLGAGVAKVMTVAALVSNASVRGIELSAERFVQGCQILRLLETAFANESFSLAARRAGVASACAASRRVELWHGDLLDPPPALSAAPRSHGALTFFSYANCFPRGLLRQVFRDVAANPHSCVRLLTSRTPALARMVEGLRYAKVKPAMYSLFTRDGDECRIPLDAGDHKNASEAAVSLSFRPVQNGSRDEL